MEKWSSGLVGPSAASVPQPCCRSQNSHPETSQRQEGEVKDAVAVRKVQKADREKLRRDRLNEQFVELGNALDQERPKNDKVTILTDTIHMLKVLIAEVNKLKAECTALAKESREGIWVLFTTNIGCLFIVCLYHTLHDKQLTQEKNELREEKAAVKSEIENLNFQYQQRHRVMFPWSATNVPVIMAPPPYPYPVPLAMPPGPIPMHVPPMQPCPYFGSQNPTTVPTPCSTFIPYPMPVNPPAEHLSIQHPSGSHVSSQQSRSPDHKRRMDDADPAEDSNNVVTDLELKMPGTSMQQESPGEKKGKEARGTKRSVDDGSSSNRFSSSEVFRDNSSSSVGNNPKSRT